MGANAIICSRLDLTEFNQAADVLGGFKQVDDQPHLLVCQCIRTNNF
jgi:hypothetical protein